MLQRWVCHECEKGWLLIQEDAEGKDIHCPFCGSCDEYVEEVAEQNPDIDFHEEMGCLWPDYNAFDKLAYKLSHGKITQEQACDYLNARLRGEMPEMP